MAYEIEVDDDVMAFLKKNAEPFSDTPNSVLRRVLGIEGEHAEPARATKSNVLKLQMAPQQKEAGHRTRAVTGTLLPEDEYELPLLEAIESLGGKAAYREIVDAVGDLLDPLLMPADRELLKSGGIRWHTRLQFVRLRLIERGLLGRDSPRGVWEITTEGRAALESGVTK